MGQNFWPPRGAQGGAQCTEFGVSEGANYSLEFCTLLVPIPVTSHPILILIVCEMFWRHLHAYHTHIFAPARVRMCEIPHIRTSSANFCIWARHGMQRGVCGRTCVWACEIHSEKCVQCACVRFVFVRAMYYPTFAHFVEKTARKNYFLS